MNYQAYLKKKTWSLEEAVFLVTGEQSDKNIKNSLTYKDAQRDIRKGILTAKKYHLVLPYCKSKNRIGIKKRFRGFNTNYL